MRQLSPRAPLEPMRPLTPMRPYPPMRPLAQLVPMQPLAPLRPGEQRQPGKPASHATAPSYAVTVSYDDGSAYQELLPPQPQVVNLGLSQPTTSNWGGTPRPPAPVPLRRPSGGKGAGAVAAAVALLVVLGATGVFKSSSSGAPDVSVPSVSVSIPPLSIGGDTHGAAQHPQPGAARPTQQSGRTLTLNGTITGERIRVSFLRFVNNAHSKDTFFGPSAGKRYFAAQFRITNTGSVQYVDSPANGARVVDSRGNSYRTTFLVGSLREGKPFDAAISLKTGDSALGYLVFEVPKRAKIHKVQFAENSGFGQVATWTFVRA